MSLLKTALSFTGQDASLGSGNTKQTTNKYDPSIADYDPSIDHNDKTHEKWDNINNTCDQKKSHVTQQTVIVWNPEI